MRKDKKTILRAKRTLEIMVSRISLTRLFLVHSKCINPSITNKSNIHVRDGAIAKYKDKNKRFLPMTIEEYKTSENMQKFFDNLKELKKFLKDHAHEHPKLQEAFDKLHQTFKVAE